MNSEQRTIDKRVAAVAALACCGFLALGCAPGGGAAHVKGRVTLDGAPLEKGAIRLIPLDGKSPTAGETIENGEFFIPSAPATAVKVEITAPKVVGKRKAYDTPDSPTIDVTKEMLPEKYNTRTELKSELVPGENELKFDLKSK